MSDFQTSQDKLLDYSLSDVQTNSIDAILYKGMQNTKPKTFPELVSQEPKIWVLGLKPYGCMTNIISYM